VPDSQLSQRSATFYADFTEAAGRNGDAPLQAALNWVLLAHQQSPSAAGFQVPVQATRDGRTQALMPVAAWCDRFCCPDPGC
jgi:hypothetical protein